MADGRPGAGPQADETRPRPARVMLAALLVAAVVAGLRGEVPSLTFRGPLRDHAPAVGLGLEAVLAVLMIALFIRRQRAPQDAVLAARLRGVLGTVLAVGLIGIPLALLLSGLPKPRGRGRPASPLRGRGGAQPTTPPRRPPSGHQLPIAAVLTALLVLMLVTGIIACVIVLSKRAGRAAQTVLKVSDNGDAEESLRAAVESGRMALGELDDARAAIVACYLAMERTLAGAGAARGTAETPDELLARVVSAGLVRGDAASRLTALFYEARFSTHPLPAASKAAARHALAELAAGPGAPAASAPGGTARGGAGRKPGP